MSKKIDVISGEIYDSFNNEFINGYEGYLTIEHSLASIHKWEQKYHKAYISNKEKTDEELMDYIVMMTIDRSDDKVYDNLSIQNIIEIKKYIDDCMTATWFPEDKKQNSESITSELIYYWMLESGIPFECENWHVNSLLALIKVCSIKRSKPNKKMTGDSLARRSELNARRLAQTGSRG